MLAFASTGPSFADWSFALKNVKKLVSYESLSNASTCGDDARSNASMSLAGSSSRGRCNSHDSTDSETALGFKSAAAVQSLALKQARALQSDISKAVDDPDFQDELLEWLREEGPDSAEHLARREELCFTALQDVLPRYGFGCTVVGMRQALKTLVLTAAEFDELAEGLEDIYDSLGLVAKSRHRRECSFEFNSGGGRIPVIHFNFHVE